VISAPGKGIISIKTGRGVPEGAHQGVCARIQAPRSGMSAGAHKKTKRFGRRVGAQEEEDTRRAGGAQKQETRGRLFARTHLRAHRILCGGRHGARKESVSAQAATNYYTIANFSIMFPRALHGASSPVPAQRVG